jgi:putative glycosyltransferase
MNRQYVSAGLPMRDANLFLGGMFYWVGFNQKGIPVKRGLREGPSTYTFKRRLELMFQASTSFSGKPLLWLFYFGVAISSVSFLSIIYLIAKKLVYGNPVELGWTSLIVVNILILGIISTILGLMGVYLFKIYTQVQNRPNSIIKKVY